MADFEPFPETLLFRAYGNDFAILARRHFDLEASVFNTFTSLADSEIRVELEHIDLERNKTYSLDKLEKMVISSTIANIHKNADLAN